MGRWDDDEAKEKVSAPPREEKRDRRGRERDETEHAGNAKKRKGRERSRSPAWGKRNDIAKTDIDAPADIAEPPRKPEFGLSGLLAAETNTTEQGVVLKHQEPPEKGVPEEKWRIYVFKDNIPLDQPLKISSKSNYLFGRDRRVVDVATDHGSCSLQHAVIQYRNTDKRGKIAVRPYLMDLDSTNGTFLNGDQLEGSRYYELLAKDVVTFGSSTREYVILKE